MSIPTTYTNWLDITGYPSSGVGDLDDLKLVLGVGENGRWIGYVKPGWYYSSGLEHYNYIQKSTVQATIAAASGSITSSSFRPAWGPVLLYGVDGVQYTEHHNCFLPAMPLTWSQAAPQVFSATLPVSSVLLGVRGDGQLSYKRASASGDLSSGRLYYYRKDLNKIYAYATAASAINAYADIALLNPRLLFRELVLQEADGIVKASYRNLRQVVVSKGTQTQTIGTVASNEITHSLDVAVGDWVVLEYYIDKSYVLYEHDKVHVYTVAGSGDTVTVYNESTPPEFLKKAVQTSPNEGQQLQFNPLFSDAFRAGFLYHSETASSGSPFSLSLLWDKNEISGPWREIIKATLLVTDKTGLPLPQTSIVFSHNQAPSGLLLVVPSSLASTGSIYTLRTDNRGEVNFLLYSTSSTSGTLQMNAVCGSLSASGSIPILNTTQTLPYSRYQSGVVNVAQLNTFTPKGYSKINASAHYLDGIPRDAVNGIEFISKKPSSFQYTNLSGDESLTVRHAIARTVTSTGPSVLNPARIAGFEDELGVIVADSDLLVARADSGQSPIITVKEEL